MIDFNCAQCSHDYESKELRTCPACSASVLLQTNNSKNDLKPVVRPKKQNVHDNWGLESDLNSVRDCNNEVSIDWLSFTFKLSQFKECANLSKVKLGFLDVGSNRNPFPNKPIFEPVIASTFDSSEEYELYYRKEFTAFYEDSIRVFCERVLGLSLSAPRYSPFNFYADSFNLHSNDGAVYCGRVGLGGNNDTVHFSINGHGCKHLFSHRPPRSLYKWLSGPLQVQLLNRIDLAFDDFDGVFDCEYALNAAKDDAFRSSKSGRSPLISPDHSYHMSSDGKKEYTKEMIKFGSRQSRIYWRIYNKKLEQKLTDVDVTWYRSEVELKQWPVEVLLNRSGSFAALCDYSRSMVNAESFNTRPTPRSKVKLALLESTYWAKRQYGKLINDLVDFYDNDLEKVISTLVRDGSTLGFPSNYKELINLEM